MTSFRCIVTSLAIGFTIALLSLGSIPVIASTEQSPNTQIISSNKKDDSGSWDRFSIQTAHMFRANGSAYSDQLNSWVNGCTNICSGSSWLQGVIGIDKGSLIGKPAGWYVHDFDAELQYGNGYLTTICKASGKSPSGYINVNQTGFNVLIQLKNSSTGIIMAYSIEDLNNNTVYLESNTTCTIPSGATGVDYFTQVEGVVVGCDSSSCGQQESFKPLNTDLFSGYIDLTSNYNLMSSSSKAIQSGENSNLYQENVGTVSTTYGSLYLYSVSSTENTKNNA